MKFIDEAFIFVKAGDGGSGLVSFRKAKNNPRGGPDGGDGGRGGNIVFKTNNGKNTLLEFKYHDSYKAENGGRGGRNDKTGANGKDLIIYVPVGTIIKNSDTDQIICELLSANEEYIIEEGGSGGKGNAFFVNSSRQAPTFASEAGKTQGLNIKLELKLLADVGIIGLPSCGKSTIISKISSAKPKIADYPFTTLIPNLGVVKYYDKDFVVADVPGLIKDAHKGTGLGIKFLKHIQRSKILVHVVDASSFNNPIENIKIINNELEMFSKDLMQKKMIYALNKIDAKNDLYYEELTHYLKKEKLDYIEISALSGENINEFIKMVADLL